MREDLRVVDDRIRVERAVSADLRALEYFRWPGDAVPAEGILQWQAPDNASERLVLRVAPAADQRIDAGWRVVVLRDRFGEDAAVIVTPGRRPLVLWLWGLLPWA